MCVFLLWFFTDKVYLVGKMVMMYNTDRYGLAEECPGPLKSTVHAAVRGSGYAQSGNRY